MSAATETPDPGSSPSGRSGAGSLGDTPSVVDGYIVRLHGPAWGTALGLLSGASLCIATLVLVMKGGDNVGQHLALLGQYLPFYSVSMMGALVGLVEGFALGWITGRLLCAVYNRAARL